MKNFNFFCHFDWSEAEWRPVRSESIRLKRIKLRQMNSNESNAGDFSTTLRFALNDRVLLLDAKNHSQRHSQRCGKQHLVSAR